MLSLRRAVWLGVLPIFACGVADQAWAQSTPSDVLTLTQAVGEALRQNDRMVNQNDESERASLSVRSARSAFRPKIVPNVQGSFGQTDVSDQGYRLDLAQRFSTGTEVRVGVGAATSQIPSPFQGGQDLRFYNTDTTLMFTQPLLKGFGRAVARRALTSAELRQADAGRQRRLTEQQVTIDVASSYYRVVTQQAMVEIARRSFDRARQLRESSEAKLNAGLVSQLDVLRAQQLVAQAELQLFDAQGALEDAGDALRFLMGRPANSPINVVGAIPTVADRTGAEEAVTSALANRPDLQMAISQAGDAEQSISYARNQLLPQVDVNLALTRRQTADSFARSFGLHGYQFATFFNISMPVDRTPQVVDFQNAIIERDRRRRDLETLQRQIGDDLRRHIRERGRLERNLTAADTNVLIAQREVEVARLRYERGLSDNLDVVNAESNLLSAESRRLQTLADLAMSRLTLRAAMGVLDPLRDTSNGADGTRP